MLGFVSVLLIIIVATLVFQVVMKLKLVPPSQLGVVHGRDGSFRTLRGGRVFVWPLINRFDTMDLTPQTTTVMVESAIAAGIVPLTVTATVSFAVARSDRGLINAVKRILHLTDDWQDLMTIANSIIEGHLRDTIAAMTPEEVMSHKDRLVQNMIQVCKSDLEGIGLEITTMNIADVDDHRLEGVQEPDLYIALLKRVQTANAESQSRVAKAQGKAAAVEQQERRRAEVAVRELENERQRIEAETRVLVAQENQRKAVGVQEAQRNAESDVAGVHAQIKAERERVEMVKARLEANTIVPVLATQQKTVEAARAEAARIRGRAQSELDQLARTIGILEAGGDQAVTTYLIEKFAGLVSDFASTMELFPVKRVSVISGKAQREGPISAIHPSAMDNEINERIAAMLSNGKKA